MFEVDFLRRDNLPKVIIFAFFGLLLADSILTPISLVLGDVVHAVFFHFFKVVFVLQFSLFFAFYIIQRPKFSPLQGGLLFAGLVAFIFGATTNIITKSFYSHIYGWAIAFFGVAMGREYEKAFSDIIEQTLDYWFRVCFLILALELSIYYYLVKSGYISYFGISTSMSFYALFFLARRRYLWFLFSIAFSLLSGKRGLIVGVSIVSFIYVFSCWWDAALTTGKIKSFICKVLVSVLVFCVATYGVATHTSLLDRFSSIFSADIFTEQGLYTATSGRTKEFRYIIKHIGENPYSWLVGGGFGEHYVEPIREVESLGWWKKHYSHFSPLYFVLVYGLPITLLIYAMLVNNVLTGVRRIRTFSSQMCLCIFITSFLGASLFVDPRAWFFLGTQEGVKDE